MVMQTYKQRIGMAKFSQYINYVITSTSTNKQLNLEKYVLETIWVSVIETFPNKEWRNQIF